MRITQQNNTMKALEVKLNNGSIKSMKSGDVFRAQVIAIHTEAILLKLSDGSNLRAQVMNPERFVEGESMDFRVVGNSTQSEVVSVEALSENPLQSVPDEVKVFLKSSSIIPTEENVKAYQVLKNLNLEISKENNLAIVKIYDNAGGIPSEIKEKIFDPYFTTKHKSQGTGIGLFMSKKIITQHFDGSIEIKNREINIDNKKYFGAEFSIKIKFIT